MTSHDRIRRGIMAYMTAEILPLMDPLKSILIAALAPRVIDANLKKYTHMDWLEGTDLVDGDTVNVDDVYKLIKSSAAGKWPIELFGVRFNESDLDKLYRHLMEV